MTPRKSLTSQVYLMKWFTKIYVPFVGSTEAAKDVVARFGGVRPKRATIGRATVSQTVMSCRKRMRLHRAPHLRMEGNGHLGSPAIVSRRS
jgi:hypothetical protein